MKIEKKQVKYNYSNRTEKIKYIVIHDTGNTGNGANSMAHFNYFNAGNRNSSANIFVDDSRAIEIVDCDKYYSWHCGDGYGKYGITNSNSIGIELCINFDGDYNKAFLNLVEVTKYLMKKYSISADKVVRHYDASRKSCPNTMSKDSWKKWNEFKNKIKGSGNVSTNVYRIRKSWNDETSQIGAYSTLEAAKKACKNGYKVFDNSGKQVYPAVTVAKEKLLVYTNHQDGKLCEAVNYFINRKIESYKKDKDYSNCDVIAVGSTGYPSSFKVLSGAKALDTFNEVYKYLNK